MNGEQSERSGGPSIPKAEPPKLAQEASKQSKGGSDQDATNREILQSIKSSSHSQAARTVPYYFAAVAGLVYAVGFFVEFTFMNSMGVKDSLTEPFKAKHIYIGILCLLYPGSVVGVLLALLRIGFSKSDGSDPELSVRKKLYPPTCVLFLFFLTAFYILVGIGRPDTFAQHDICFGTLFLLAILSARAEINSGLASGTECNSIRARQCA
jgi:hypothetical protein